MKIDRGDFERVLNKLDKPVERKHIIDMDKYYYWDEKASEFADKCIESKDDKEKHIEYLHQSLLYTLERNLYYRMTKKENIILWIALKYHNSKHEEKLYVDRNGRRVKYTDRKRVRK